MIIHNCLLFFIYYGELKYLDLETLRIHKTTIPLRDSILVGAYHTKIYIVGRSMRNTNQYGIANYDREVLSYDYMTNECINIEGYPYDFIYFDISEMWCNVWYSRTVPSFFDLVNKSSIECENFLNSKSSPVWSHYIHFGYVAKHIFHEDGTIKIFVFNILTGKIVSKKLINTQGIFPNNIKIFNGCLYIWYRTIASRTLVIHFFDGVFFEGQERIIRIKESPLKSMNFDCGLILSKEINKEKDLFTLMNVATAEVWYVGENRDPSLDKTERIKNCPSAFAAMVLCFQVISSGVVIVSNTGSLIYDRFGDRSYVHYAAIRHLKESSILITDEVVVVHEDDVFERLWVHKLFPLQLHIVELKKDQ